MKIFDEVFFIYLFIKKRTGYPYMYYVFRGENFMDKKQFATIGIDQFAITSENFEKSFHPMGWKVTRGLENSKKSFHVMGWKVTRGLENFKKPFHPMGWTVTRGLEHFKKAFHLIGWKVTRGLEKSKKSFHVMG